MTISKVMIIDDNPLYKELLLKGFNKFNIEAVAIDDTMDFISIAAELNPDFILLDIMMPNKNGFEICKQLKTNSSTVNIPIIFVSSNDDAESVINSFHVGSIDYIKKPVKVEDLIKVLISHNFQTPIKDTFCYMRETLKNIKEKYSVNVEA